MPFFILRNHFHNGWDFSVAELLYLLEVQHSHQIPPFIVVFLPNWYIITHLNCHNKFSPDDCLVSGPVALPTPAAIRRVNVETAEEMLRAVQAELSGTDIFIGCAAVADYRPQHVANQKIKRSAEEIKLDLVRSPDTLASVAAAPNAPFTVGFAAETQDVAKHAREKLTKKRVDMIAANQVGPDCGFDRETNSLSVFWEGAELNLGEGGKPVLARRLIELIADRFRATRSDARRASSLAG